jgi:hypothetical protein
MFVFPKHEYIGRSVQRRKPLNEIHNKPILEKYNTIIDKYLFSAKKQVKKHGYDRLSTLNGPHVFEKNIVPKQRNMYYPSLMDKHLNSLNIEDYKIPDYRGRNQIILDGCVRKQSYTPTFDNKIVKKPFKNSRAKSVHARQYSKISKMLQTDQHIIVENESQDEESPLKFTPIYEEGLGNFRS